MMFRQVDLFPLFDSMVPPAMEEPGIPSSLSASCPSCVCVASSLHVVSEIVSMHEETETAICRNASPPVPTASLLPNESNNLPLWFS